MARKLLSIISLVFIPSLCFAQQIEGEIGIAGEGLAAGGAEVKATCADVVAVADEYGHYEFRTARTGECRIEVKYRDKLSTSVTIYVSAHGTRASLELRESDRGWHLSKR